MEKTKSLSKAAISRKQKDQKLRDLATLVEAKTSLLKIAIKQLGGVMRVMGADGVPDGEIKIARDPITGDAAFMLIERDAAGLPIIGQSVPILRG